MGNKKFPPYKKAVIEIRVINTGFALNESLMKRMSQSHGTRADVKRWSPALKQHVSPKVMITVTCGFMLHGPIRRRRVN